MYIGKLAALTGATPKAIRHYETLGLLPVPKRQGRYRVYTQLDVQLVSMIRRAQTVGFSLAEITGLAKLKAQQKRFPLDMAQQLFREKHRQIQQQKARLDVTECNLFHLEQELVALYANEARV